MASAGTTSIDDLPTNGEANITLETSNKPVQSTQMNEVSSSPQQSSSGIQLSSNDISKIVEGIQMASSSNMTTLPSRDIPQNQAEHTNDPQVQPNHVPVKQGGFIEDFDTTHANVYREQIQQQENQNQIENVYDSLQTPIMISVIYFIFQLPFLHKMLFKYAPSLFLRERQLSISGYLFKTLLFGSTYYFIQHIVKSLSAI